MELYTLQFSSLRVTVVTDHGAPIDSIQHATDCGPTGYSVETASLFPYNLYTKFRKQKWDYAWTRRESSNSNGR